MLWENIVIQSIDIARAQRIMFVQDREDMTKVLKRHSDMESDYEKKWELQHAWDKQATFLQAQSRAIAELRNYEEIYQVAVDYRIKNPTAFILQGIKYDRNGEATYYNLKEYYYDGQKTDNQY
ncbi:hypothetical protein [Numidum massiliense]|uniref:hypothetical protein n=1 Tax=Numidum massiliense TaxID=1522315 RepID=UPI0006D5A558|nr:hypothetical protein [Numidum massiliense]